jgi:Na+-driven multidrug efflux pump
MKYGYEYLAVMSLGLPILYVLHAYKNAMQGFGNTVGPMISGFAEFIMRTGSALILPAFVGYWGIFYAEVLAWLGADVILVYGYYKTISVFPHHDEQPDTQQA